MKQEAIQRINKLGHVGQVVALICKIFLIMGIVLLLAGTIAVALLPKDLISATVNGGSTVHVNLKSLGVTLTDEQQAAAMNSIMEDADMNMDIAGMPLDVSEVQASADGIVIHAKSEDIELPGGRNILAILIASLLTLVMLLVTVFFINALCKAFRYCETPFSDDVIKKLQALAFSLIPWVVISNIADAAVNDFWTNDMRFSVDLGMIMVVFIVFVLVYIFKYGAMLQQESDETL